MTIYVATMSDRGHVIMVATVADKAAAMVASRPTLRSISETDYTTIKAGGRWSYTNDVLTAGWPDDTVLATSQIKAKTSIDNAAETARSVTLTTGSGMAYEYRQTEADAVAYLAGPTTVHPWLDAEQTAQAAVGNVMTLQQVAELVMSKIAADTALHSNIKQIRRTAKLRVEAATTAAQVQSVLDGLVWPTAS
jgi:hypothetical protein